MGNSNNKRFIQTYHYVTYNDLRALEVKNPSHFYSVLCNLEGTVKVWPNGKVEECRNELCEHYVGKPFEFKIGLDRKNWDLLRLFLDTQLPVLSDGLAIQNPVLVRYPNTSVLVVLNGTWHAEKKHFTYQQTLADLQHYFRATAFPVNKLVLERTGVTLTNMEQLQFRDVLVARDFAVTPDGVDNYLLCVFDLPEHGRSTLVKAESWKECYFRRHRDNSIFKQTCSEEFLHKHLTL